MSQFGLEFSEIYGRIQDYANIVNVVGSAAKAKKAANDALRLLSTKRNWEILKREANITPVASTQSYVLATGFDHIISVWYISNGSRIDIDVVDDTKWQKESDNDTDGTPVICRITKVDGTQKIQFSPRPSASFIAQYTNIPYDYIKKPAELVGDTDVPEIPDTNSQMVLVYLAVADLLAKQGDLNGMAVYEKKAEKLINDTHKVDDKKQGRIARLGTPMIPAFPSRGIRLNDYND